MIIDSKKFQRSKFYLEKNLIKTAKKRQLLEKSGKKCYGWTYSQYLTPGFCFHLLPENL